jgi:uncharacterized BrkB/YihY/UPF0761 family membrane protein
MNDVTQSLGGNEASASSLVRRLSIWLVGGAAVLMALAVTLQLADIEESRELELGNASPEVVARIQWGTVSMVAAVWMFFIYAFWSLGKRKEWSRKATIGIFSILTLSFAFNGGMTLLMSAALLQVDFAKAQGSGWSGRIVLAVVGSMLLILAWLCWRLIRALRTRAVRDVFQG